MVNLASKSWEWGTAAEALLELYNPELSVFGADPFPGGKVPNANSATTFALRYARQFISVNGGVLVPDSAAGDPASLGVSAILIGQSDRTYLDAANRQAHYLLSLVPRWSNGAISHRPDVAELWADNMAMSFPFLAYQAVQTSNASLMAETVNQCGLQRAVLKTGQFLNWRHIIGPQSQDTGLWSTGNGWAGYGMARVLHTLQKWSGSASMTSQAAQLKGWIQEILDGAMLSGSDDGLLRNYLNDAGWFGEVSGTALLSAIAYRMAVNDPAMFPQKYITWADTNRKAIARHQNRDGILSPAVNPSAWLDRNKYTTGSPEGQTFAVYLHTAYRDCVLARVCAQPATPPGTTISAGGIGPYQFMTVLGAPITFTDRPAPTGIACGNIPESCEVPGCDGGFEGLTKYPVCRAGPLRGCRCAATAKTCGPRQSCGRNECRGSFDNLGNVPYPRCTGNFEGCECEATESTCGPRQSCDRNGCSGSFDGLGDVRYPKCTKNFVGCDCTASENACGPRQSCDKSGCQGSFNGLGLVKYPQCTNNFVGCNCTATENTCGPRQSCDDGGCSGSFNGLGNARYAQCVGNFVGCNCTATPRTCGPHASCDNNDCAGEFSLTTGIARCTRAFVGCECTPTGHTCGDRQSCDANHCEGAFEGSAALPRCQNFFKPCQCNATPSTCGAPQDCSRNGCDGDFNLADGKAYCTRNFIGCACAANAGTCGRPQSCDAGNCRGEFPGLVAEPVCTNFFRGCKCIATPTTCGQQQSCDRNGCAGAYDGNGVARCRGNFVNCPCIATSNTCGTPQECDKNNCHGAFINGVARCRDRFVNCPCIPVPSTCGTTGMCRDCDGGLNGNGNFVCKGAKYGCACIPDPIWIPPTAIPSTVPTAAPLPPLQNPWYCLGLYERGDCNFAGCTRAYSLGVRDMTNGEGWEVDGNGAGHQVEDFCGKVINGATVECYGDLNSYCSAYGVVKYKGRTCRTRCPDVDGDSPWCYDINNIWYSLKLAKNFICDRALG